MNTMFRRLVSVVFVSSTIGSVCAEDWSDDDPIRAVLSAWKERTIQLNDVECSWEETRIHLPGSLIPSVLVEALDLAEKFATPIDPTIGWPEGTITATAPRMIRLHGNWMFNEDFSLSPVPAGRETGEPFVLETFRSAFDGELMTTLSGSPVIKEASTHDDMNSAILVPLRSFLRPLSVVSTEGLVVEEIDVPGGTIRITDSARAREFVVDANRGFGIVSLQKFKQGTDLPVYELSMSYKESSDMYLPDAWEFTQFRNQGNREVESQIAASSVHWLTGRIFEKKDFQLEIPQGIKVTDLRPIDIMAKTEVPGRSMRRWAVLLLNVLVAGFIVLFFGLRWLNRRRNE